MSILAGAHFWMSPLQLLHELRGDSDHIAAILQCCVSNSTHQPLAPSSIHEGVPIPSNGCTKVPSTREEVGGDKGGGGAVDCDLSGRDERDEMREMRER